MSDTKFKEKKENYTLSDLLEIMAILRSPKGCSWDREQDHHSIRRDFLEECYEAVEAIDTDNPELLREELGDVLLQVVFHSRIEEEAGRFHFYDVVNDVAAKMIVRHPHVFGDVQVTGTEDVLRNWDAIKKATKDHKTLREVLESVSPAMPALMRHQKILSKAMKAGAVSEPAALEELQAELQGADPDVGRLLALTVAIAKKKGIDAEEALCRETEKLIESVQE